jgi:hypothetical protein
MVSLAAYREVDRFTTVTLSCDPGTFLCSRSVEGLTITQTPLRDSEGRGSGASVDQAENGKNSRHLPPFTLVLWLLGKIQFFAFDD